MDDLDALISELNASLPSNAVVGETPLLEGSSRIDGLLTRRLGRPHLRFVPERTAEHHSSGVVAGAVGSADPGSITREESLARLVRSGAISRAEAMARSGHPDELEGQLRLWSTRGVQTYDVAPLA